MAYRLLDEEAPAQALPPKGKFVLIDDGSEPASAPRSKAAEVDDFLTEQSGRIGRQVGLTARAGVHAVTGLGEMAGNALGTRSTQSVDRLLDWIGLPKPENPTERIAGDVASAIGGQGALAKVGGLMSKVAQPVVSRIGDFLKADQGAQTIAAGTGTAASSTVREKGGSPGAQLAAGVGTSALTNHVAMGRPRGSMPRTDQALLDEAEKHDVPLSYSDVTGKGKRLDTALEQVPFVGTSGYREAGAKKVTEAAERVVGAARYDLDKTPFRGMDGLKQAAAGGDKRAQQLLDQITNAGDDWQKIMQTSGNLKLWRSKEVADELYGEVERLAQPRGNMPVTRTLLALDDAIAAETSSKLPDQKQLSTLQTLRNNLATQGKPTDFSAARQLRSDLGDIIDQSYKGENALVGAKGAGKLQEVKNAIEQDMADFATAQGGELQRAWKRADSFYRNAVVPYKDKALARALSSDTPDEIYAQFIKTGRSGAGEDRAAKFFDALDPKGKAAVRFGMVSNALDEAAIPGKDTISPARFSQSLEKIAPGTGVFFKGEDKAALDGFSNLMRHAERFGQYAENPPTGQRVIPLISVLGGVAYPKLAMAIAGGSVVAKAATTRPALRDALIRASNAKPGTLEMEKLAAEVARLLPQASVTSSRSASQQQPEQ